MIKLVRPGWPRLPGKGCFGPVRLIYASWCQKDGSYRIDPENSRLEWIGRNLNNRHFGRIDILGGDLVIAGGRLSAGIIVLDMNTISNLDLLDPVWRDMLITHLKSDDFFEVERFPVASLTLTGGEEQEGASSETPDGFVTGDCPSGMLREGSASRP